MLLDLFILCSPVHNVIEFILMQAKISANVFPSWRNFTKKKSQTTFWCNNNSVKRPKVQPFLTPSTLLELTRFFFQFTNNIGPSTHLRVEITVGEMKKKTEDQEWWHKGYIMAWIFFLNYPSHYSILQIWNCSLRSVDNNSFGTHKTDAQFAW